MSRAKATVRLRQITIYFVNNSLTRAIPNAKMNPYEKLSMWTTNLPAVNGTTRLQTPKFHAMEIAAVKATNLADD